MTPTSTTSPPAQPGREGRELLITHTYTEGTVLTGTHRSDDLYRLLRSHGWLYRRSMSDYRLQASQDRPAKTGPIARTAAALRQRGFTVTVGLDTTPRPMADAEADREDRAAARSDRLHGATDRLTAQADEREAAARRVLDHIPLGQPMLIDHHSYRADRRRRERAFTNLDASAELARQARATEQAAQTAGAHMVHRYHPETVANRIRELEAELRRLARRRQQHHDREALLTRGVSPEHIAECALTPQQWARLDEQQTHLTEQLTHWSAVRQAQIRDGLTPNYTRADLAPGDLICYRGQWLPVVRCNPKSVSVPSIVGGTWTDTVRYDRIRDRARPGELRWPQLATAALAHAHHWSQGRTLHPAWQQLTGP